MKNKVFTIFMFLITLLGLISCQLNDSEAVIAQQDLSNASKKIVEILPPAPDGLIRDVGVIRYIKLEGGFWGIYGKRGNYDPVNLPNAFKRNGLRVVFTATLLKGTASIHMWGSLIKLKTMISQTPKYPAVMDEAIIDNVPIQGSPWLLKGLTDTYQAINLPEDFMIPGLKVCFTGVIRKDIVIIPNIWPILEVKEINALEEIEKPQIINLGKPFKLNEEKQALEQKQSILFTFKEVLTDSRCPINARCFWAGEAVILVNIKIGLQDYGDFKLSTQPGASIIDVGGYSFELQDLVPYPVLGVKFDQPYTGVFIINPLRSKL